MAGPVGAMPNVTSVLGMPLDQGESLGDDLPELLDRLDQVIGGEHGDHGLRIVRGQHGRAEPHGVQRVAASPARRGTARSSSPAATARIASRCRRPAQM